MDYEFYLKMEIEDFKKLIELNSSLQWFKRLERNELMDKVDVKAIDIKGRNINIELKSRTCNIDTYSEIFIEESKYDELMKRYKEDGCIPLYINFFNDDKVAIWDLRKTKHLRKDYIRIFNKGSEKMEDVTRYMLSAKDSLKYKKDKMNNNKYSMLLK